MIHGVQTSQTHTKLSVESDKAVHIEETITLNTALKNTQQELIDKLDLSPEALRSLEDGHRVANTLQVFSRSLRIFNLFSQIFKNR